MRICCLHDNSAFVVGSSKATLPKGNTDGIGAVQSDKHGRVVVVALDPYVKCCVIRSGLLQEQPVPINLPTALSPGNRPHLHNADGDWKYVVEAPQEAGADRVRLYSSLQAQQRCQP